MSINQCLCPNKSLLLRKHIYKKLFFQAKRKWLNSKPRRPHSLLRMSYYAAILSPSLQQPQSETLKVALPIRSLLSKKFLKLKNHAAVFWLSRKSKIWCITFTLNLTTKRKTRSTPWAASSTSWRLMLPLLTRLTFYAKNTIKTYWVANLLMMQIYMKVKQTVNWKRFPWSSTELICWRIKLDWQTLCLSLVCGLAGSKLFTD